MNSTGDRNGVEDHGTRTLGDEGQRKALRVSEI
jgi:hypothetical protein